MSNLAEKRAETRATKTFNESRQLKCAQKSSTEDKANSADNDDVMYNFVDFMARQHHSLDDASMAYNVAYNFMVHSPAASAPPDSIPAENIDTMDSADALARTCNGGAVNKKKATKTKQQKKVQPLPKVTDEKWTLPESTKNKIRANTLQQAWTDVCLQIDTKMQMQHFPVSIDIGRLNAEQVMACVKQLREARCAVTIDELTQTMTLLG